MSTVNNVSRELCLDPRSSQAVRISSEAEPDRRYRNAVLIGLMLLLSTAYMAKELKRGWFPHDEGTLAQSAERVNYGELPHRDFDEIYTGGLTFLNAAAFRVLGPNLATLRYVTFAFFLAWVPVVCYISARFVAVPVACAVTLLAVAWGYPNYAAAMPSWYNLFFATFGLASLVRYIETPQSKWLLLAGFFAGCSVLVKISSLFFIGGVLLFLLYRVQEVSPGCSAANRWSGLYRLFVCVCVFSYTGVLFQLLRAEMNAVTFGYLFVPAAAVAVFILWGEFGKSNLPINRFGFLFREAALFSFGILIPTLVFVIFYARHGAVSALFRGVFILPQQRFFHHAAMTQSSLKFLGGTVVDLILIWSVLLAPSVIVRKARIAVAVGLPLAMLAATRFPAAQKGVWSVFWNLLPIAILGGLALLIRDSRTALSNSTVRQKLFLLLSVTAGCSLIQFPFFVPSYFCYVAPLAVLSCTAVLACAEAPPRLFLWILYGIVLSYVVLEVTPGFLGAMGSIYARDIQTHRLKLSRAGELRVSPESAETYEALGQAIHDHARGDYIYASPDCPEVYFLYGFRNPTPTLFDFFDDPVGRTGRILALVRRKDVNLVVLNHQPAFSDPVPRDLSLALRQEFPESLEVGQFEVRWEP